MAYTTIDDPSAYFQTALYTGNQTARSITNDGNSDLQPDWVWDKNRTTSGYHHNVYDSSRGVGKQLRPNEDDAEISQAQGVTAFNSDGFSLGTDDSSNKTNDEYVAWQWKANGGTTSSNSDGSITSTVQANTTAGFSIVTYTGNGSSGATVGHGLSDALATIILKRRVDDGSGNNFNWQVWHKSITDDHRGTLNANSAFGAPSDLVFDTSANTTSVLGLGFNNTSNQSSKTYIAYCFAEKQGYSKFGSYTGNGNADGPFVYTGFKPAWVMTKNTDNSFGSNNMWIIYDNKRVGINPVRHGLFPDANDAESADDFVNLDLLSNGFKLRANEYANNYSGDSFIYMAFAESPFVSSKGVPTTAR